MRNTVIAALRDAAEPKYAAFQKKLCPDTALEIWGVRLPRLRSLAKEIARGPWRSFLTQAPRECYEEVLLQGLVIAYAKAPLEEKLSRLEALLPWLDSWALTDSIVPTFRFAREDLPRVWDFAQACLRAAPVYTRRLGLIVLLDYFLTPDYLDAVAEIIQDLTDDRYYVCMAAAWLLAELGIRDYNLALKILAGGRLNCFTQNKAIAKMRESYRFTPEQKAALLAYKRKEAAT